MARPKSYDPKKGKGGGRQKMWNALRRGRAVSSGELMSASGSAESSVRSYIAALVKHEYVQRQEDGLYLLVKNTGARAPSVNMAEGTLYDWNVNKPMSGKALQALWKKTGLSVTEWARQAGLGGSTDGMASQAAHRLIEMFDGKRPVSPTVEEKATAFDEKAKAG